MASPYQRFLFLSDELVAICMPWVGLATSTAFSLSGVVWWRSVPPMGLPYRVE